MSETFAFQDLPEAEKRKLCPAPEPPKPAKDWRWWSLWIPPICSALGFFLFGIFGYGFSQVESLPPNLITVMVIVGAILLSLGGEVGTVSATWEILRRYHNGESVNLLDWSGLLLSVFTSIATLILSWAWLQNIDTGWSEWMKMYGPLCLGALAIGDFTVGCIEAGTYLGTHDRRLRNWEEEEYKPWRRWVAQQTNWAKGEQPTYEAPTGEDAYTPPLPLEAPVSVNGDSGHCWCGQYCKNSQAYSAHQRAHMAEAARAPDGAPYTTSVQAREAMRERYEDTIDGAREGWEFPDLATVNGWREKVLG